MNERIRLAFMERLALRFADDCVDAMESVASRCPHMGFAVECDPSAPVLRADFLLIIPTGETCLAEEEGVYVGCPRSNIEARLWEAVGKLNERAAEAKGGAL